MAHYPAPFSVKTFEHLAQMRKQKGLFAFDYGWAENLKKYGSEFPYFYDLEDITTTTTEVALFIGLRDNMASVQDAEYLL